jgi:intein/homing endonuclease
MWHRKSRKCRAFGTLLQLADGSIEKVENLIGKHFIVLSLMPDSSIKQSAAYAEFNGIFDVYTLKTENGRQITVTENHPFLTLFGWKELKELNADDMVLVPMDLPIEGQVEEVNTDELKFVAYMIGDGSLSSGNFRFTQQDNTQLTEFKQIVKRLGGSLVKLNQYDYRINGVDLRNVARRYGVMGRVSGNKEIPSQVFTMKNHHIAVFLNRLFSTDGYNSKDKKVVGYTSKSKTMIEQIQLLLLRFSITASLITSYNKEYETNYYHLLINNDEMVYQFASEIGITGKLCRWDNVIGEEKGVKKHKYKARIRKYAVLNDRFAFVKIKDLVYEGKQSTVAISVPETQNYISSFVEHNTTLALNVLIRECCRHPKCVFSYVGPTYKQSRAIVWDDPQMLDKYLPDKSEMDWKKNEQKLQVRFANGAVLRILGADDVDSLRGPDNMGVVFDEWQLVNPTAWSAVFFPMINLFPDRWAIFLWTAFGRNHAQELQERRAKDPAWYVGALPAYDTSAGKASGLLTEAQLAAAQIEMPETLYRQEYGCESIAEEEMCLINSAMIEDLKQIKWSELPGLVPMTRKIVSIDTAFGGDVCSIRGLVNARSLMVDHSHPSKTEEIVLKAKQMCKMLGTKNIISDCIGWGKGVTDMLAADEVGYNVQYFNSANSPTNKEASIYANHRAEAYGYTSDQIRKQRVQPIEEKELIRQLPKASRYKATTGGKMLIIPKTEIRKDLGCSPDDADSFVMGIWGLQFVTPEEDLSRRGESGSDKRYGIDEARRGGKVTHNPMVGC